MESAANKPAPTQVLNITAFQGFDFAPASRATIRGGHNHPFEMVDLAQFCRMISIGGMHLLTCKQ
jgi:hypothetical protein